MLPRSVYSFGVTPWKCTRVRSRVAHRYVHLARADQYNLANIRSTPMLVWTRCNLFLRQSLGLTCLKYTPVSFKAPPGIHSLLGIAIYANFSRRTFRSASGSPAPRRVFIHCPTRYSNALALPALKSFTTFWFASRTPSTTRPRSAAEKTWRSPLEWASSSGSAPVIALSVRRSFAARDEIFFSTTISIIFLNLGAEIDISD